MDRNALRAALIQRVGRKVGGRGIPAGTVAQAVEAVVQALPSDVIEDTPASGDGAESEVVLALTAASAPDLASRARRALEGAGVTVKDAATATSGRHTVVTMRIPAAARAAAEGVARAGGWKVSLIE